MKSLKHFHIMLRENDALERLIVQSKIKRRRLKGRYINIRRLTNSAICDCTHNAMDRDLWKDIVNNCPS